MRDDFTEHPGEPAERGRLVPDDRPGGALPMNPLQTPSYARPYARMGWPTATLTCGEIGLEPPESIDGGETLVAAARRLAPSQSGFLPVTKGGQLRGALYIEDLLKSIAAGDDPRVARVGEIASRLLPTVQRRTLLADAVRLMIGSFMRRIAVVDDDDQLVGFANLSEAAAMADRDQAVRDLLGEITLSPSVWARRFR